MYFDSEALEFSIDQHVGGQTAVEHRKQSLLEIPICSAWRWTRISNFFAHFRVFAHMTVSMQLFRTSNLFLATLSKFTLLKLYSPKLQVCRI